MTHIDILVIIAALYKYFEKKGLSKSKRMRNIFIIVLCLLPIRMYMLVILLQNKIPIYYHNTERRTHGSTYLYETEQLAVAGAINLFPLFYPVWLPYSYGVSFIRTEFFPDFYKNRVKRIVRKEQEQKAKECAKTLECDEHLTLMLENEDFENYLKIHKSYYMRPRKNKCKESINFFRGVNTIYDSDYKKIYNSVGKELYTLVNDNNCSQIFKYYSLMMMENSKKENLSSIVHRMCTKNGDEFCYYKFFVTSTRYQSKVGNEHLKEINKKLCKHFDGFKKYRKSRGASQLTDSTCLSFEKEEK